MNWRTDPVRAGSDVNSENPFLRGLPDTLIHFNPCLARAFRILQFFPVRAVFLVLKGLYNSVLPPRLGTPVSSFFPFTLSQG